MILKCVNIITSKDRKKIRNMTKEQFQELLKKEHDLHELLKVIKSMIQHHKEIEETLIDSKIP